VIATTHGRADHVDAGLHGDAAARQQRAQQQGQRNAGQGGNGGAAGAAPPGGGGCLHGRQLFEMSLLALAALLMMLVNGSSWFTKRLQRVTPAAPTNTTSPGSNWNWLATAKAAGDLASSWYTTEGCCCSAAAFAPRITYTALPSEVAWASPRERPRAWLRLMLPVLKFCAPG